MSWIFWLNNWYCGLVAALFCLLYRISIIHGHSVRPTIFALFARQLKGGIKVVADIHGAIMEEDMYARQVAQPDKMARQLDADERLVLQKADWIIFVSEAMRGYYQKRFGTNYNHSVIIPCATDGAFELLNGRRLALRQEHGLDDKLVFCYAGSGGSYQLPGEMCELFKNILHSFPDAFFLIFSHYKDVFLKHLKAAGIDAHQYSINAVSHTEIFSLLQMGDFGFLLRDSSVVNQVASPTKFGEYCLCGLPVITTDHIGDFSAMVKQHKLGWVVDLKDLAIDSKMAAFIANVKEQRVEYIQRCSSFAREQLSWNNFGPELKRIYSALLGS